MKISPSEFLARFGTEKIEVGITALTILLMEKYEITMDDFEKAIKKVKAEIGS